MSVKDVRQQAWQLFEEQGLPKSSNEHWKYTDMSSVQAWLSQDKTTEKQ